MEQEKIEALVDLIYKVNDVMNEVYPMLKTLDKVFLTDEEYENQDDSIFDLPRISRVDKHGFYEEYAIIRLNNGDIVAKGVSENYGKTITCTVDDLNYDEAITLLNDFNRIRN